MLPPGVESWTDTSNNEAFLAGKIGYTHNAFSVYAQSKRDNNPVFTNIVLLHGAEGQQRRQPRRRQRRRLADHLQGRAERRSRQEAGARPARPGQLHPDVRGGRRPVHAGLREPVDRRAAGDRSEPRDHQGAGRASPTRSSGSRGRPIPNAAIDAIRAQGVLEQSVANVIAGRMAPGRCRQGRPPEDRRHLRRRRHHAALARGPGGRAARAALSDRA